MYKNLKLYKLITCCIAALLHGFTLAQTPLSDSAVMRSIYSFQLTQGSAYEQLRTLTKTIGGRLSGSKQAEAAVYWAKKTMLEAGADTVYLQACMVPHWERGQKERALLLHSKTTTPLKVIALGSSVGTGPDGLEAEVVEVKSFEELEKLGSTHIQGKIVFYNVFFDQSKIRTGAAYGEAVVFRSKGASMAAQYGAVASVVRSMASNADDEPHTGNMNYYTSISERKIPAFALSYTSADILAKTLKHVPHAKLRLVSTCRNLAESPSFNVIGELKGSLFPNQYLICGGHLDSWDNGEGAHDDGAGIVQSIAVLEGFKKLGIRPYHTLRAVAFMNEENGLGGALAYANNAKQKHELHLAALESDAGGFTPRGFGVDTTKGLYQTVKNWMPLFKPYFIDRIDAGGGGADISPLEEQGVPCIGFEPDTQRYFDIHHTAADTFDKINKRELLLGAAGIQALMYLLDRHLL